MRYNGVALPCGLLCTLSCISLYPLSHERGSPIGCRTNAHHQFHQQCAFGCLVPKRRDEYNAHLGSRRLEIGYPISLYLLYILSVRSVQRSSHYGLTINAFMKESAPTIHQSVQPHLIHRSHQDVHTAQSNQSLSAPAAYQSLARFLT